MHGELNVTVLSILGTDRLLKAESFHFKTCTALQGKLVSRQWPVAVRKCMRIWSINSSSQYNSSSSRDESVFNLFTVNCQDCLLLTTYLWFNVLFFKRQIFVPRDDDKKDAKPVFSAEAAHIYDQGTERTGKKRRWFVEYLFMTIFFPRRKFAISLHGHELRFRRRLASVCVCISMYIHMRVVCTH